MNILVLQRVPYSFIQYHEVIDHEVHHVFYIGLKDSLASIPTILQCEKIERSKDKSVVDGVLEIAADLFLTFDRLICMSQYEIDAAAEIREKLNIPGDKPSTVKLVNDKLEMKSAVASRGLLVPKHLRCLDAIGIINSDSFSWQGKTVLKPVDGTASKDVLIYDDLASALIAIHEGKTGLPDFDPIRFELEEFMEGPIYHFDGIILAKKELVIIPSRYVGTCLDYAAGKPLGSVQLEEGGAYCAIAKTFLDAVGLETGVFHLEMIETSQGLCFLEIAARVGGADVATVMEATTGLNMIHVSLALALDERPLEENQFSSLLKIKRQNQIFGWFVFPGHLLPQYQCVQVTGSDNFNSNSQILHWREVNNRALLSSNITYNHYEVPLSGVIAGSYQEEVESLIKNIFENVRIQTTAPTRHLLLVGCHDIDMKALVGLTDVLTLFQKPERVSPLQMQTCTRLCSFDYENIEEALTLAREIHSAQPIHAVASFTEYGLETASVIKEDLNIAGNPFSPVAATRDKFIMRTKMAEGGLPSLRFKHCKKSEDLKEFLLNLQSPVIIKPAKGSGSEGVYFVSDDSDVQKSWEHASASSSYLIAEEFIFGPEVSVESFSCDGCHEILTITEKQTTGSPYFVETGHQMPAQLSKDIQKQVHTYVRSFLEFIGHKIGPAHTELRLTKNGPRIIEAHTRGGGDFIWEMVKLTCGVNFVAATVAHLLTKAKEPRVPEARGAAIRFINCPPGKISSVEGIKEASSSPGIIRVDCSLMVGDQIKELQSSDTRVGYVLGVGGSRDDAVKHVEAALSQIVITVNHQ